MKLIVLLSVIAFSHGEKLDKVYLPPNAQASGGSNEILQTPISRPIVVVENEDFQRQIAETVEREEATQRTVVNNVVEYQRPIVTNVVKNNAAFQRPVGFAVNRNNQGDEDVVRIGNRGNFFVQNQNPVEYKEVQYQGPRYQAVEQRQERTQAGLERNAAIIRQEYKNEGDAYAYAYETENGIRAEENGVATNGVNAKGAFSYVGDDGVQYSMSYTADENGFQPQGDHIPRIPEEILRSLEQNARDEAAGIFDDGSYDARKYGGDAGSYDARKYGDDTGSYDARKYGDDTGSYDERKYGGNDAGYQQRVSVVTSRPNTPTLIQSYTSPPTYIQPRPTVPTITQNYPTVPTIDQRASNNEAISNSLYSKYRLPGYRYPSILVNQKNNLSPVVNALIQEVTPIPTRKVYLPPVKRKVITENRPTKLKRKTVIVKKKPAYKKDDENNKS